MCVFCGEFPGCNGEPWCEFCLQTLKIGSEVWNRTTRGKLMRLANPPGFSSQNWCPRLESNQRFQYVRLAV